MEEEYLDKLADKIVTRLLAYMPDEDQFLTVNQIRERTGYSTQTIHNIVKEMKLRRHPGLVWSGGKVTRVSWNALERYMVEERRKR